MRGQRLLQGAVEHARLHHRATVTGADLDDAVHAGERQRDTAGQRHRRAGGAGTSPTCDQGHAMRTAGPHQSLHLFDVGWQRHRRRVLVTP